MGNIRPCAEGDMEQVATLHRQVFSLDLSRSAERQEEHRRYFRAVFLEHPWISSGLPSLVFEDDRGRIGGFLGVVPRPIEHEGEKLMAAVSTQFVVREDLRARLVGVELLRAFLRGRQDVSIADEANDEAKRLWERLGGSSLPLPSVSWTRVLKPASRYRRKVRLRGHTFLASMLRPVAAGFDAASARARVLRRPEGSVSTRMEVTELHEWLTERGPQRPLKPGYRLSDLVWLLARDEHRLGVLEMRLVTDGSRKWQGCHVYFVDPSGVAEVIFSDALPGMEEPVFRSLVCDARDSKATELSGRMAVGLITPVSRSRCRFNPTTRWMLVHSKHREVVSRLQDGAAVLSKLEGEYPTRFR